MQTLEALAQEARALARGELSPAESEVARQLQICNACRYCEGFCGTFLAMTRSLARPMFTFWRTSVTTAALACMPANTRLRMNLR
jgi:hypothetical protein